MKYVGEIIGKGIVLGGGSAIGHSIVETLTTHLFIEKEKNDREKLFSDCLKATATVSSYKNLFEHLKNCEEQYTKVT